MSNLRPVMLSEVKCEVEGDVDDDDDDDVVVDLHYERG